MIPTVEIPAGTYPMGDNALKIARKAHTIQVEAFALGQTTVTNEQYAAFIRAEGYMD